MNNQDAKTFPLKFLSSVPVNIDLKDVFKKFFVWMLTDNEYGVIKYAKTDATKKAIQDVSDLLQKSMLENVTTEQFLEVRNAAYAADAAAYAARQKHFKLMGDKLIQIISETN